jgi:hypothetical protein
MGQLLVNDELHIVESAHETWAELLDWADGVSAGRGLLVTAVRVNGVDEPSFRRLARSNRALSAADVIEIGAAPPDSLVAESLVAALSGLAGLRAHALDVARRFRDTRVAVAHSGLAELTHGLGTLVTLVEAISRAMDVAGDEVTCQGRSAFGPVEDLGPPLEELADAEHRQEWTTIADILEVDLEPAISRVAPLLTALAARAEQAGPLPLQPTRR